MWSLLFCGALLAVSARQLHHILPLFWDARVYLQALRTDLAGGDPYRRAGELNFVSPPIFLAALKLLVRVIPIRVLGPSYLASNCLAFLFIPWVLSRWYLQHPRLTLPLALAIFFCHPYLVTEVAFFSANLSNLLYAAILAAGVPGLERNRWSFYYVVVAVASILKAQFLALLLLPLLVGEAEVLFCVLVSFTVFLGIVLEGHIWPAAYHAHLQALWYQLVIRGDMGMGLARVMSHERPQHLPPSLRDHVGLIVHFAVMGPACLALLWLRFRGTLAVPRRLFVAAALVMAVLLNPRLQGYDTDVAILPAFFLLVEELGLPFWRRFNPFGLALLASATALFFAKATSLALLTMLLGSVLLLFVQPHATEETLAIYPVEERILANTVS